MIGNAGPINPVVSNRQREMAVFDALPDPLRRAFVEASCNFTVIPAAEALLAGAPVAKVLAFIQAEDRYMLREAARRVEKGARQAGAKSVSHAQTTTALP